MVVRPSIVRYKVSNLEFRAFLLVQASEGNRSGNSNENSINFQRYDWRYDLSFDSNNVIALLNGIRVNLESLWCRDIFHLYVFLALANVSFVLHKRHFQRVSLVFYGYDY